MNFIAELKRRNVIRMAGLYLVGAWLVVQVASTVLPMFNAPVWLPRSIVIVFAVGFIPALIFSWVFELTPDGLKRDEDVRPEESIAPQTARRMDRAIIVVLLLALGYFGFDRFVLLPQRQHAMIAEATRAGVAQAKAEAKQEDSGKSIAVLPFDNRSGDTGQDYYADGLTDELTTTLARISALKVIARTSAARFKGSDKSPSAIGRELGVAALVTGSVLRAGGRVRYTAELVSAVTEKTLWADSFERDERDVLTLQSQVAQAIAKAIEVRLSPTEATRLAGSHTVDPRALDEYLRGRALWNRRTEGSVRDALKHFQNATRIAPDFSLGYVGIADSGIILGVWGFESPGDVFPIAKKAAEHALELDPTAGEAHASLGDIYFHYYWDWPRSQREHEQAMALSPAFATAYQWDAEPLEIVGDYAGAIAKLRHAQELDPLSMVIRAQLGRVLALSGHRSEAIAELRDAIALDPEFLRTRRELVRQLLAAKRNDEALLQARQLVVLDPHDVPGLSHLGLCLGRNGFSEEARAILGQLDGESKKHFVSSLERARISAGLGERETTLNYLEKAVADREGNVPYLATDGEFDFLHGDPRYVAILRAIGIPKK